jgi:DNA-directed RNA polymerase specialized sigma24 family protein
MTTWLTTIVRNCALMQLRKRPRQIHLPLDEQTGGEEKFRLGETRGHAPKPRRGVSQFGTQCTPARMRRTVVANLAEDVSAAGLDGALGL